MRKKAPLFGIESSCENLHARFDVLDDAAAILQLAVGIDALDLAFRLVLQVVLEARPEVHGDGAQLNLDRHHLLGIEEIHGNADDHVQAAVPVGLGVGDIVLDRDDFQIVLTLQQVEQVVHTSLM